uniref:Uncharacterized protein n=1 Tax=Romanomermis culicivorax TaxID=13658 RepID=A0A915L041_ROMCU
MMDAAKTKKTSKMNHPYIQVTVYIIISLGFLVFCTLSRVKYCNESTGACNKEDIDFMQVP